MITARLRLPGGLETVLEIPEREGRPDALDLLDAAITRLNGGDWGAVLGAARQAQAEGGLTPIQPSPSAPEPATEQTAPPAGVRETSRAALDHLRASGRLSRQQTALVAFLEAHPGWTYTRAELAEAMGWRIPSICGRVFELLAEPFGVLEEVERRPCAVTGERAMALCLREPKL